jgi:hypothetical protein
LFSVCTLSPSHIIVLITSFFFDSLLFTTITLLHCTISLFFLWDKIQTPRHACAPLTARAYFYYALIVKP